MTQSVIPFANVAYPRGYTRGSPKRNFAHDVRSFTAFHYFVFSASFAAKKYTAAETAAIQRDEGALAAKEFFLVSAKAPETGAIQGAFSASSFWYPRFRRFVRRYVRYAHTHGFTPVARQSVTLDVRSVTAFHYFANFA